MNSTIFTSCDSVYLREHAPALVASAVLSGHDVHLHVSYIGKNDETSIKDECGLIIGRCLNVAPDSLVTYSVAPVEQKIESDRETRVYYACDRFYSARHWLKNFRSLIIVDTDCLIMRKMEEPAESIGLFLRKPLDTSIEWETEGTRVAAGLVYVKNDILGQQFLDTVVHHINDGPARWFLDQVSLSRVSNLIDSYKIHKFGPETLDWEFLPGTTIWTGKGDRKHNNETYLSMKKSFARKLYATV